MNKEQLNKFYFSNSSQFGTFSKRGGEQPPVNPTSTASTTASTIAANVSASQVDVTLPSSINDDATSKVIAAPSSSAQQQQPQLGGGSAVNAVRTISSQSKQRTTVPPADAARAEYFQFLKQQQELQRDHNRLEEVIAGLRSNRQERQTDIVKRRGHASNLLAEIEASTDWKLRSKYDIQQLIRDCNMALQPTELVDDSRPATMGLNQIANHLQRIRKDFEGTIQLAPYELVLEQDARRLGLVEQSLLEGNMDATALARVADTVIVQLETNCQLATLETLVKDFEDKIERLAFNVEEMRQQREAGVADGEVHIAEKLCYEIIQAHERILEHVVTKARVLEKAVDEAVVVANVSAQYHAKIPGEVEKIKIKCNKLRSRCEEDVKKMFALREKVEEVEAQTAAKLVVERETSDVILRENSKKLELVWAKMEELEREAELLERERYKEIQKRLVEKDKDEHRKAEFAQFCHVVETHLVPLQRTMKNMDLMIHAADAMNEMLDATFVTCATDVQQREKLLRDIKLEAHKEHCEIFRNALLELGEIIYRKERMIEETDKKIRQAHVQQELLAETFNPNAKKFGDIKKSLLANRDELEKDVQQLKERAAAALSQFEYSEKALAEANVEYVHPVTEQQHHTLAIRARMIEFKAMIVGHNTGNPVMIDIDQLKSDVMTTRQEIEQTNISTSGCMAKALPMIQAANRVRSRH